MIEEKEELIPCSYERCFDYVFNQCEENLELFISTVLDIPKEDLRGKIKQISNNAYLKNKSDKKMQMDFVYQIDNLRLNIELNLRPKITKNRNIGYVIKSYAENIKKTLPSYNSEYKTIQININSENIFENKKIIEEVYLRNKEGELYSDKIGIYLVNVANLKKMWYTDSKLIDEKYNCLTSLFVRRKNSIEKILEKEGIRNIMERMEEFSSDKEEWVSYRDENEIEKIEINALELAKEEGKEEGKKQGIAQGINLRNIEIAKNMLKKIRY